jgi:hypothetical protein
VEAASGEGSVVNVGAGLPEQAASTAMPQSATRAKARRERSPSLVILPPQALAAFCDLITLCSVSEAPVA